jgi:uncharacterized protein (DUF2249 family)
MFARSSDVRPQHPNPFGESYITAGRNDRPMSPDPFDDADERLDAREIDGEPFGDIVAALDGLDDGESLCLVNGFEPVPLYDVLAERGFTHETANPADDEWHVEITRA